MAITTGAADTGVLSLDMGSRPRATGPGEGDGDAFASTLDTQMQKPRTEHPAAPPRAKRDESTQDPEKKGKAEDEGQVSEGRPKEREPVVKGKEKPEQGAKAEEEPAASLVALILQAAKGGDAAETSTASSTGGQDLESGKSLPQPAANDPAAVMPAAIGPAPSARSPMLATGVSADTRPAAAAVAATTVERGGDPRLATLEAARSDAGAPVETKPETVSAQAPDLGTRADKRPEGLPQREMQGTGAATADAREKGDSFAATLAALRETVPRVSPDGAQAVAPAAMAPNTPQAGVSGAAAGTNPPAINVPVGQPGWDQAMGERVLWMTRHGLQEAKIEINPRDLGPIEIKVSVQQDQASVAFTTHTPAAREALEAAMPRLREMMADSGLNLAQSDVSHRSPQQQAESGWGNGGQHASGNLLGSGAEELPAASVETPLPSLGAVDYYA